MWIILSIYGLLYFASEADMYNSDIMFQVVKFVKKLFTNKNWFGIILGIPVVILIIPTALFCLVAEIIMFLCYFVSAIWELGNKK